MKPFNLESALRGENVVTRDGREVTELHYFMKVKGEFPVSAIIEGIRYDFATNGSYILGSGYHEIDLFMACIIKIGWINIYCDGEKRLTKTDPIFNSRSEAKYSCSHYNGKQIKIEWEE